MAHLVWQQLEEEDCGAPTTVPREVAYAQRVREEK
jgi:hypothetical protein